MTIKEFARLCGCNPQTLRYYDHVDLLKPVRVDQWSRYRLYDEEQALDFVKIKNLQRAGFTIEEIKGLLEKYNLVIYQAFEAKIAEAKERLREIQTIQKSYQTEMNQIQKKIYEARESFIRSMRQYDPAEEFGISTKQYENIIGGENRFFDSIEISAPDSFNYEEFLAGGSPDEVKEYLNLLNNPHYEIVYEKHGWINVKDFLDQIKELDDGTEYALLFRVIEAKGNYNTAFANTVLGILLSENAGKQRSFACNVEKSRDDWNHFWLLKQK